MVIILMIMVMKFAKNQTNTMAFQSKYTPLRHYYLVKEGPINLGRSRPPPTVGQDVDELIFENAKKKRQKEAITL